MSGKKGAEVGILILCYASNLHWRKTGKVVMMHLPRAGRMPDDRNIAELKEIRRTSQTLLYCALALFTPYHFGQAIEKWARISTGCIFDTAAVLNPAAYELARKSYPRTYPVRDGRADFLWSGKRIMDQTTYQNLARGFAWNTHIEGT